MDISRIIAEELEIEKSQAEAFIRLVDEGNTIPFIARYRKEQHGGLSDEILRRADERLTYLRGLEERKNTVRDSLVKQGVMTEEVTRAIDQAMTLVALEDIYRPYKPKRRTRAMVAREKGLEGLAAYLRLGKGRKRPEEEAASYLTELVGEDGKGADSIAAALQMARDIIAEDISDTADFRSWIREITERKGFLVSEAKDGQRESVYENYYQYEEAIGKIPGHRILAINRGEKEKFLRVKIQAPEEEILSFLNRKMETDKNVLAGDQIREAVTDAYKRLIAPSIESEIRGQMTELAQEAAIQVFGKNLEELLMDPPLIGKVVLGWDPAFRTGCKLAVCAPTGKVLATKVIYPTEPHNKVAEAKRILKKMVTDYKVDVISLGNGTASRESERIIADFIKEEKLPLSYVIVNESGASVYSASPLATEEFPNFDVGQRSAVSMARRLQDPLAELVKIDPKSLGVGQYQHDLNQTRLSEALAKVVESCVNKVGIDVNTASAPLLAYVAGINKTIAKNIVTWREENGHFTSRKDLLKVAKLGPKAFEQAAGFLRIRDGKEILDNTAVHPESYKDAKALLSYLKISQADIRSGNMAEVLRKAKGRADKIAKDLDIGNFTLLDMMTELAKPGRDPREKGSGPILRADVLEMEDLKVGMELKGTVRNITDFGAFVDIGVHQDGLVHISQLAERFVKNPMEVVSLGQVVDVRVLDLDLKKHRISLTMKKS